jgi:DNA-binding transcriptional regulator LsrR (DeoR family)
LADFSPFQVATMYWNLPAERRCWGEVAEKLGLSRNDKVLQNRLGRMARQWEELGHVRHTVLNEGGATHYFPRVPLLEDELRRRFPLRQAVVVDTAGVRMPLDSNSRKAGADGETALHEALGLWASRVMLSLMRKDDVIGVGGGRGPFFAIKNCRFRHGLEHPHSVHSLSGSISANIWEGDEQELEVAFMDADPIASRLGGQLAARHVQLTNRSIAIDRPADRKMVRSFVDSVKKVTLAIVGIGALSGGHRLLQLRNNEGLEDIVKLLERLKNKAMALDIPGTKPGEVPHHWVADLCCHLFVATAAPSQLKAIRSAELRDLEKQLDQVNSHLLCPKPEHLAAVCSDGAIIGIGGGRHKVAAVQHVLTQKPPWISHLVTDSFVASQIVANNPGESSGL